MSRGALIALAAVGGLAAGIVVSLLTDLPLAPEIGAIAGAVACWAATR